MARALAHNPTLRPQTLTLARSLLSLRRPKSSRARDDAVTLIEIDIEAGSGPLSGPGGEIEIRLGRVEEALHNIYALKSAPDWLPFVPGSSYWVPPKSKSSAVSASEFVNLVKTTLLEPLAVEEVSSAKAARGQPAAAFYVEGTPVRRRSKKAAAQSDDED